MRLKTTVTGYYSDTKVCSYCCSKVPRCGILGCYDKCMYCDYLCYDMLTYNKYYYNNETLFCSNKVYSNVDYSYFSLMEIEHPINQTNVLNVNINKNTCSNRIGDTTIVGDITIKFNFIVFLILIAIWLFR